MKEECKLCSGGWGGPAAAGTTDFSISSLMGARAPPGPDPRHDALLLSTYLLKLGDYPFYTLHDHYTVASASACHDIFSTRSSIQQYLQTVIELLDESPPDIASPTFPRMSHVLTSQVLPGRVTGGPPSLIPRPARKREQRLINCLWTLLSGYYPFRPAHACAVSAERVLELHSGHGMFPNFPDAARTHGFSIESCGQ
ncbi:hypothetical protein EVAR_4022_1 [Eumeta japonica]|uniref:Uncharacterized protein n=1 Tax=Eumeta variegata TaxID=151549 RepID=A0A4C1T796_EUMVA|nr:hypothetical protein EVAR_4022_1 [Eumeta japonica]